MIYFFAAFAITSSTSSYPNNKGVLINMRNTRKSIQKLLNLSHLIKVSISYQVEVVNLLSPLSHP